MILKDNTDPFIARSYIIEKLEMIKSSGINFSMTIETAVGIKRRQ